MHAVKIIKENALQHSLTTLLQLTKEIETVIDEVDRLSQISLLAEPIIKILKNDFDNTNPKYFNDYQQLEKFIGQILKIRRDIDRIVIQGTRSLYVGGPNNYFPPSNTLKSEPWYDSFINQDNLFMILPPHRTNYTVYNVLSVIRKIQTYQDVSMFGIIEIDVRLNFLDDLCRSLLVTDSSVLLLDKNYLVSYAYGSPLSSEEEKSIATLINSDDGTIIIGEKKLAKIITYKYSPKIQCYTVFVIPQEVLFAKLNETNSFVTVVSLICCIIAFLLTLINSFRMTIPLKKLLIEMQQIEQGNLNTQIEIYSNDELGIIAEGINRMISKVKLLMEKNTEIEVKNKEAQMIVLQGQISPHFIFNTLECIRMQAVLNNDEATAVMLEELGFMIRAALGGNTLVSLAEELQYGKTYISLQNKRFYQACKLTIDVPEKFFQIQVPRLIIQPIIENAIKHGLEQKKKCREIEIIGTLTSNKVFELCIRDNGAGIEPELLDELNTNLSKSTKNDLKHIGLRNVHQRLILYLGSQSGIKILSKKGKYTAVAIHIPQT